MRVEPPLPRAGPRQPRGGRRTTDSTVGLYAEWGVDFIKADDMLWPYQVADIEAYAAAVERVDRTHRAEPVPRPRPVGRAPRAPARARHHVAGLRRRLGSLGRRHPELRAIRTVGAARRARGMAGRRHAAARAHRHPRRARRAARRSADPRRAAEPGDPVGHGPLPAHDRRRPALERPRDDLAVHERRGAAHPPREHGQPRAPARARARGVDRRATKTPDGSRSSTPTTSLARSRSTRARSGSAPRLPRSSTCGRVRPVAVEPVHEQSNAARSVAPGSSVVRVRLEPHGCALLKASR